MNILKNIKDAKYFIGQLTNTAKKSVKTDKQRLFYKNMINCFIDLVDVAESSLGVVKKSKPLPSAFDLEQAVIGALLIDGRSVKEVVGKLSANVFYDDKHKLIIQSIIDLNSNSKPIDLLTVSEDLIKKESIVDAGGDLYLINLTEKVSSSAHIDYHVHILLQYFIRRFIINISNIAKENSLQDSCDVFDLMEDVELRFNKLNGFINKIKDYAEDNR